MQVTIIDLDGTIADDRWRRDRVRSGTIALEARYNDYHSLAGFDKLVHRELTLVPNLLAIFTTRPIQYKALTEEWLRRNEVLYSKLFMRPVCNHSLSAAVKEEWLQQLLADQFKVVHAYDDRAAIIQMYRRNGVPATQVTL